MRLNEIRVNAPGVLEDVTLSEIPGLSVIHGSHGSGKSTLARFVRRTLHGLNSPAVRRPDDALTGSLKLSDAHHRWMLSRYRSETGHESTHVLHLDDPNWTGSPSPRLPAWVSNDVLSDILFPGHEEADRFSLLVSLCLQSGRASDNSDEILQARSAIAQAVREREGTTSEPGLNQQIATLQRQRDALTLELQNLGHLNPEVTAEIRDLEDLVAELDARQRYLDQERIRLRGEIAEIEQQLSELRSNSLQLNREVLTQELSELNARSRRWRDIRETIEHESLQIQQHAIPVPGRSRHSVRAVIDRLEQRMLATDREDHWHHDVEQETAALCRFVSQQQRAADSCEATRESQYGSDAATAIHRIESMLQDQLAALQEEIERADNILDRALHCGKPDCQSGWHRNYDYNDGNRSDAALEARLRQLNAQLSEVMAEFDRNASERRQLTDRLSELRRLAQQLPSLEEIDDLNARIAEVNARLELLTSHLDVLVRTERSLEEVIARLQKQRSPGVLSIASEWLARLTDGECQRVFPDFDGSDLFIETTRSSQPLRIDQLSRGTQQQLALVLRLALLRIHSATTGHIPFVIDDVFITSDDARGSAAADLLRDVASHGQQIVILTCQNDVRALLAARGARVYSLSAAEQPVPAPTLPISKPETSLVYKAFDGVAEECPGEMEDTVVDDDDSHWLFYLEPEHAISDLSGLDISELKGLTAVGLETIGQLLDTAIPEAKANIQEAGYFITEDRLQELQTQATMAVCVPMLRQRDAELLVATGIDTVRQLARLRPEAIYDLVLRFQQSDSGTRFLRSGRTIDQQQAISWNRWALHARTVDRAKAAAATRRSRTSQSNGILTSLQRTTAGSRSRRDQVRRSGAAQRRRVRTRLSEDTARRREARRGRRIQRSLNESPQSDTATNTEQKFYLNRSSDVEAAPSIGSVTAARLARVGIETVDDLLECDAQTVATLLDNRRITSGVIEQWKAQSALVCTIPKLRGHDAQILVACGKYEADEITSLSPDELYSVVQPFCDTTEGARIIRGGRKPDIKEVSDWISWARLSRPLKAA